MSAVIYWCLWLLFYVLGRLFFRYRAIGRENIPQQGGLLVAANHASFLDIPLLGCGIPRRAAFLGRQDLFPVPGLKGILQWLGWIPIRHDRLDRTGFGKAIELIKSGKVVVIYPEGTRTRDGKLHPGKPGIGTIVAQTGCPVVPAYIRGTYEALPMKSWRLRLHPVQVTYGKPIDFSMDARRYAGKKELYRHVSRTVMAHIAELGNVTPPAH
ncbi:MAG: lysophospholipid acyltransferase family protein [Nitrospiraceae bacterium]